MSVEDRVKQDLYALFDVENVVSYAFVKNFEASFLAFVEVMIKEGSLRLGIYDSFIPIQDT